MFNKGNRVYDIILDKIGTVIHIGYGFPISLPVQVYWDDRSQPCNYTLDGRFDPRDSAVRLYLLDGSIVVFHIPPEEKKKVKVYKWLVKESGAYIVTLKYYREGQIEKMFENPIYRIEDSMKEVDE